MFKERIKHFHLIGIGGIGMSGIAHILLDMGYQVSGSDISENTNVKLLKQRGAKIRIGHRKENLPLETQVVVYSSAIAPDNPEIVEAKRKGIPTIPRGEMLAEFMRVKEGIAVSGSHGKTTTTSMLAHIFYKANTDPTVVIGGKLHIFEGKNARLGKGDIFIAEADESDGSFLKLSPTVAVVTNIDREHLDHYGNFENIKRAFLDFLNKVPFYGFSVANLDDESVREILTNVTKKVITYGITSPATVLGKDIEKMEKGYRFALDYKGKRLGKIEINLPGKHNIYNALAAITVALESGIDFQIIKDALREFKNAERRMQFLGRKKLFGKEILFFEDYGHHPREIEAVLKGFKEFYPNREILFVFQPHRYTRSYYLWEEFVAVLKPYKGIVTEIYPASEKPIPNVTGERLAKESESLFAEGKKEIEKTLKEVLKKIDKPTLVVFLGAGSIGKWSKEIVENL
jgi:UDP-N-acetylmuramate--alanine ligase